LLTCSRGFEQFGIRLGVRGRAQQAGQCQRAKDILGVAEVLGHLYQVSPALHVFGFVPASLSDFEVNFESGIPVIDISALSAGGAEEAAAVASALCEAATTVGFFYVSNHGIAPAQVADVFALATKFFASSVEQKRSVAISPNHRGWLEIGAAKMYGSEKADQKESFVWGLDIPDDDPDYLAGRRLLAPNQWPEHMPEMRETLNGWFAATQQCGQRILEAFAVGLGIRSDFFRAHFNKPVSRGSLIYYPPRTAHTNDFGSAPHSDYGTLTLLAQDEIGGLEVKTRTGEWIRAVPLPGTFVVNVGDLLARWSNGLFESTPHRVVNPAGRARYSVAMFVDPNWDSVVEPAVRPGESAKFAPIRCADYIYQRYDEAFSYRDSCAVKGK
jgi:isopenicillin N synthase-like dioxygenase